jgi:hypothetical protein
MFPRCLKILGRLGSFIQVAQQIPSSLQQVQGLSHMEREYVDYNNIRNSSCCPFSWPENGIFSSLQIAFKQVKRAHKILYVERK